MKEIVIIISYLGYVKFENKSDFDNTYPISSHCKLSNTPKEFPVYVQFNGIISEYGDNYILQSKISL